MRPIACLVAVASLCVGAGGAHAQSVFFLRLAPEVGRITVEHTKKVTVQGESSSSISSSSGLALAANLFHIFAALAEFERDMIRERTSAGLAAAHKRGVAIGRPRALTPEQILMAEAMTDDPAISTRQVAEQFGIHRSTLYRHLNARQKRSA